MNNKLNIFSTKPLQLVNEDTDAYKRAVAGLPDADPSTRIMEFVLLDDIPNLNRQRVPADEFTNIINTGKFKPLKVALGGKPGKHKDSEPIGVITELTTRGNQIVGLAALWGEERPGDVQTIKALYESGQGLGISWELLYGEADYNEELGCIDLKGITLTAATLVKTPSYGSRTPVTAVAEYQEDKKHVEELEKLQNELTELKAQSTKEVAELKTAVESKEADLTKAQEELEALRAFKVTIENDKAEAEKFEAVKKAFAEAGLNQDEAYFTAKRDMLLSMDEKTLAFLVEGLKEAKATAEVNEPTPDQHKVPPVTPGNTTVFDVKTLGEELRKKHK